MNPQSKLKNLFKLSCRVAVYVPSTVNVSASAPDTIVQSVVDGTLRKLAEWFGGSTSTPAVGHWLSPSAGLVKERITLCFAYCTSDQLDANVDALVDLCAEIKSRMGQESVALEINGELYFV